MPNSFITIQFIIPKNKKKISPMRKKWLVLGLLWQIIKKILLKNISSVKGESKEKRGTSKGKTPESELLDWVNTTLEKVLFRALQQALRSKFLVTAKGWYWQTLQERQSTFILLYCCTMLLNFLLICLIFLVVNLYIVLVDLCTGVLYMLSLS